MPSGGFAASFRSLVGRKLRELTDWRWQRASERAVCRLSSADHLEDVKSYCRSSFFLSTEPSSEWHYLEQRAGKVLGRSIDTRVVVGANEVQQQTARDGQSEARLSSVDRPAGGGDDLGQPIDDGARKHPGEGLLALRMMASGAAQGRPAITSAERMADVILALSGTSNGRLAVESFQELEKRTGRKVAHLAEGSGERYITYADTRAARCR